MSRSLRWTDLIVFTSRFTRLGVVSLWTLSRNSCLVLLPLGLFMFTGVHFPGCLLLSGCGEVPAGG